MDIVYLLENHRTGKKYIGSNIKLRILWNLNNSSVILEKYNFLFFTKKRIDTGYHKEITSIKIQDHLLYFDLSSSHFSHNSLSYRYFNFVSIKL